MFNEYENLLLNISAGLELKDLSENEIEILRQNLGKDFAEKIWTNEMLEE